MQEPNKRPKISQEINNNHTLPPLPSKESSTTAFDYFNHPYFFDEEDAYSFYPNFEGKRPKLRETLHEFFLKVWKESQKKGMHSALVWELYPCRGDGALEAIKKWAEENDIDDSIPPRMASVGYKIQD